MADGKRFDVAYFQTKDLEQEYLDYFIGPDGHLRLDDSPTQVTDRIVLFMTSYDRIVVLDHEWIEYGVVLVDGRVTHVELLREPDFDKGESGETYPNEFRDRQS